MEEPENIGDVYRLQGLNNHWLQGIFFEKYIRFTIILAVKYPKYNGFTMKWEIWVE